MKVYHRMALYAVGGIFAEVLFTALKSLVEHRDYTLHGKTQLWVIVMYGLGGLWFEVLERYMREYSYATKITGYVANTWVIEYIGGMVMVRLIGDCPWRYTGWSNVSGFIQLSYFPVWAVLGGCADYLIWYLRTHEVVRNDCWNELELRKAV